MCHKTSSAMNEIRALGHEIGPLEDLLANISIQMFQQLVMKPVLYFLLVIFQKYQSHAQNDIDCATSGVSGNDF